MLERRKQYLTVFTVDLSELNNQKTGYSRAIWKAHGLIRQLELEGAQDEKRSDLCTKYSIIFGEQGQPFFRLLTLYGSYHNCFTSIFVSKFVLTFKSAKDLSSYSIEYERFDFKVLQEAAEGSI